ncbi:MAG: LacI family DNA-binding transcriptional regulator [Parvibaculaceae bacterium]
MTDDPPQEDEFASSPQERRTIKEIAREAGVSTATVSRVLNNPERVRPERRAAVLEVIERHDYVLHGMAGALAGARSMTIGLVIPTITNSIYAASTQAIQRVAQRESYGVLLGVSEFSPDEERRMIRHLVERRVDGLILTGGGRDPASYRLIERHGIPCVVTWRLDPETNLPCVSFDNYAAGRLAMRHLIELGHRRIGLICGRTELNDRALERRKAYEDTLNGAGIAIDPALIFERDFEFIEGRTAMRRMLDDVVPPTAVFAANDIQAIGAVAECRASGLDIPKDMSIMGFDDLPLAEFTFPKLTTIRVPAQRMGHVAATRLLEMIRGQSKPASEVLPVELILRESTAVPRA